MLSDRTIKQLISQGLLFDDPLPYPEQVGPASVDLRLGNEFLEPVQRGSRAHFTWGNYSRLTLEPGEFILGCTVEVLNLPSWIAARVEGRSSAARLGLLVHLTAGFIDPGFHGVVTLELKNLSEEPITISVGTRIAQVCFERLDQPCENPYNGKYQGATTVEASKGLEGLEGE